jgi:RecA/RadA recombinase
MFHSGKTVSSGLEVAALQEEYPDDAILYVDAEHALDIPFYCLMNGIDPDRLWVFEPEIGMSAEQILGTVMEMVDSVSNLRYIVIDSVAALVSESDMSSEFEKDNGMRASIAKSLHKFCREIISPLRLRNIGLKFINQSRITGYMRGSGGSQIPIYGEYGGTAIGFFSSVSKRFGTRKFIDAEGNELSGTKGDGAAGFRIYFNVIKNKTAPTARGGGFITYYYETGLDVVAQALVGNHVEEFALDVCAHDAYRVGHHVGIDDEVLYEESVELIFLERHFVAFVGDGLAVAGDELALPVAPDLVDDGPVAFEPVGSALGEFPGVRHSLLLARRDSE